METPKVLLIEHDEGWYAHYERHLGGRIDLLKAKTLAEGHALFCAHQDVLKGIILGGCTPGDAPLGEEMTPLRLLAIIRTSYRGPVIGTVGDLHVREAFRRGGCDAFCARSEMPARIRAILGVEAAP